MKLYARAQPCGHFVFIDEVGHLSEIPETVKSLREMRCEHCDSQIDNVDVIVDSEEYRRQVETQQGAALPRIRVELTGQYTDADRSKAESLLVALGGRTSPDVLGSIRQSTLQCVAEPLRSVLTSIPVGLHSSYSPNAKTILFPGESRTPVIVFHWGLAGYIFLMNRALVQAHDFTYLGERERTGQVSIPATISEDEVTRLTVGAVRRFLFAIREPPGLPPASDPQRMVEMALTRSIEMFVLAHEYAHAVLGHNVRLQAYAGKCEFYSRSREVEFEADVWAQDLLAGRFADPGEPEPTDPVDHLMRTRWISQPAPLIFFLYAEFLNRMQHPEPDHPLLKVVTEREQPRNVLSLLQSRDDHPSPMDRFRKMKEYLDSHGHWQARHFVRMALEAMDSQLKKLTGEGIDLRMGTLLEEDQKLKVSVALSRVVDEATFHPLSLPILQSLSKVLDLGIAAPKLASERRVDEDLERKLAALQEQFWSSERLRKERRLAEAAAGFEKCLSEAGLLLRGVKYETASIRKLRILEASCHFKLGDILSPFDVNEKKGVKTDPALAEHHFLDAIASAYSYWYSDSRAMLLLSLRQVASLRLDTGDSPRAREAASLAVRLDPDYCDGYVKLAESYRMEGDEKRAQDNYLRAADCPDDRISSSKGLACWNVAATMVRRNEVLRAGEYLSRAVNRYRYDTLETFLREVTSPDVAAKLRASVEQNP